MTSPAPVGDPVAGLPAAARQRTAPGAEAFVRYFVELVNRSGTVPSADPFGPLAADGCKACAFFQQESQKLVRLGARYSRPPLRVSSVAGHPMDPGTGATYVVSAILIQAEVPIMKADGSTIKTSAPWTASYDFELRWGPGYWQLLDSRATPPPQL